MTEGTTDDLSDKRLCHHYVGDPYLSVEIRAKGRRRKCSYCSTTAKTYQIHEVAERIDQAFAQHYTRTSDQPNDWQYSPPNGKGYYLDVDNIEAFLASESALNVLLT